MKFIRILTAATKSNTRTKRLTKKKPAKVVKKKPTSKKWKIKTKSPKTAPKRNLTRNTSKSTKPNKTTVKTRNKPVSRRFKIKPTSMYPLQDVSTPVFEDLLDQGYNMITLVPWSGACEQCQKKRGKTMPLAGWLSRLQYDAPVFEAFHVNAQSELKVWDKNGELPDVYVNYEGDIHE